MSESRQRVRLFFFFSSRRRHTRLQGDWSSDVCSSDLILPLDGGNMMLAFIEGVRRKPSLAVGSWISVFVALAVAGVVTWLFGPDPFALLWLGLFALQNVQHARAAAAHDRAPEAAAAPQEDALERP